MVKLTLLYGHPADAVSFESYFATTHLPLAAKITGMRRAEFSIISSTLDGSNSPWYRIAELYFDDLRQLENSMGSPGGLAAVADLPNFANGGVTSLISELT